MISVLRRAALVVAAMLVATSAADAQRFGAQVNWGSDSDLGVGARAEFDLSGKLSQAGPLSKAFVIAAFDYYFMDCGSGVDCTYWELNPSLAIPIGPVERNLYVGAGINYASMKVSIPGFFEASDSQTGINLLGGMKFPLGSLSAFTEARIALGGSEQIALSFGVLFGGSAP